MTRDSREPFAPGAPRRCQGTRARTSPVGQHRHRPGRGSVLRSSPALPGSRCSPPVTPAPGGTRDPPVQSTGQHTVTSPNFPGAPEPPPVPGTGRGEATEPPAGGTGEHPAPRCCRPPVSPGPRGSPRCPPVPSGARYLRQRAGQRRSRAGGAHPGPSRPVPVPVPPPLPAPGEAGAPPPAAPSVGTGHHRSAGTLRAPGGPPPKIAPIPGLSFSHAGAVKSPRNRERVPPAASGGVRGHVGTPGSGDIGNWAQRDRGM